MNYEGIDLDDIDGHWEKIPEVNVPEGTPVVGYKLFYRTRKGALKQVYGTGPANRENGPVKNDYFLESPNVDMKNNLGFYYWEDLELTKAYSKWQIGDALGHDPYIPYESNKYWEDHLGTFEIRRVEGNAVKKKENPFDAQNEGSVMTDMMIGKEVLARFNWKGDEIPINSVTLPTIPDSEMMVDEMADEIVDYFEGYEPLDDFEGYEPLE